MLISEIINESIDTDDSLHDDILNSILAAKAEGIAQLSVSGFVSELQKSGYDIDVDTFVDIVDSLDVVDNINNDVITVKAENNIDSEEKSKKTDPRSDVKKLAKSQLKKNK